MKKIVQVSSTCFLLLLATSSFAQKRMASNDRNNAKSGPQFIENVTIDNESAVVNTVTTKKKTYKVENDDVIILSDGESIESTKKSIADINTGKQNNAILYGFIEDWYGIPYRYGGETRKGIDCSAFVRELYDNVYSSRLTRTSREQFANSEYISNKNQLKEGDLVFFKIRSKSISHVGVYLADGKFVHSSRSKGVVISNLEESYWARYYVGGGRVKK